MLRLIHAKVRSMILCRPVLNRLDASRYMARSNPATTTGLAAPSMVVDVVGVAGIEPDPPCCQLARSCQDALNRMLSVVLAPVRTNAGATL